MGVKKPRTKSQSINASLNISYLNDSIKLYANDEKSYLLVSCDTPWAILSKWAVSLKLSNTEWRRLQIISNRSWSL
jgi:hypothetical protein